MTSVPVAPIHAGEFVVGDFIERHYRAVNLWVPARDTGIDLLVTDPRNQRVVSLQVKFSRDYLLSQSIGLQKALRACSWWALNRQKLRDSEADYWVLVLMGWERRTKDFMVIKPSDLLERLDRIHGKAGKTIQSYLWVTKKGSCWEARGLKKSDKLAIAEGRDPDTHKARDFSLYLNKWGPIKRLLPGIAK